LTNVLISVEGLTEERFVKEVLYDHLLRLNIYIKPSIIVTRKESSGADHKGGYVTYAAIRKGVKALLGNSNARAVTTMYDFYGLPRDFPGCDSAPGKDGYSRVKRVEEAMADDINDPRFIPYIQLHEFEGLLFTLPELISDELETPGTAEHQKLMAGLQSIRAAFSTPEDINDDPEKHPSKRIMRLAAHYNKVLNGTLIARSIGIEKIRGQCPHFNEWLMKLEKLSQEK
jgi:hypothetical protein